MAVTADVVVVLPALSVALAVKLWLLSLSAAVVKLQPPNPTNVAAPRSFKPSNTCTDATPLVSLTVPDSASVLSLVKPPLEIVAVSPVFVPIVLLIVSLGLVVSTVIVSAEVSEVLLAKSLKWAEINFALSAPRSPGVTVRFTKPASISANVIVWVTGCKRELPPSFSSTVSPTATDGLSATVNVGLVTLVMLSVGDTPESEASIKSGVTPAGVVVSCSTLMVPPETGKSSPIYEVDRLIVPNKLWEGPAP